jgi:FkbM family methyltransferase
MKKLMKKVLNVVSKKVLSKYITHNYGFPNSDKQAWEVLKRNGFTPRTIIDVGAAVGKWTSQVITIFPNAKYLMVDPLKENEKALRIITEKNPNVQFWSGAVGKHSGELEFHVHGDQSSMFDSTWGRAGILRRVPMKRLDDLVKELGVEDVDALKLDVQGAEMEVLAGASEILKGCKVVQVEVSFRRFYEKAPLAHEVIRFFAEQGFRIFDIAMLYKRNDNALLQADFFFVSDDKLCEPETWKV